MRKTLFIFSVLLILACEQRGNNLANLKTSSTQVIGGEIVQDANLRAATVHVNMPMGICTGSYIGGNRVVTAAHCIAADTGGADTVEFFAGDDSYLCTVVEQVAFPEYEKHSDPWYDIAVLEIACQDPRFKSVVPFQLVTADDMETQAQAAGYGLTEFNGEGSFPILNSMKLKHFDMNQALNDPEISDKAKKEDKLATLVKMVQEKRLECYESSAKHTMFFGDSGGPQFFQRASGEYVLTGVNDAGYAKDDEQLETLYAFCSARVLFYKDWVLGDLF